MTTIPLNKDFWNQRYLEGTTGWDLGQVSNPIAKYIDQLTDTSIRILIPGCGNAYEAAYLAEKGFENITLIDIVPALVQAVTERFSQKPAIKVLEGDFFEHNGEYDLIIEQTFFCAIDPAMRRKYVQKMATLLSPKGKIIGLLFNKYFENPGPPFGGTVEEYQQLFEKHFRIKTMESCYNSVAPRAGTETFIILEKN